MADMADLASAETDTMIRLGQLRARSATRLLPTGQCHNCEEPLALDGQLFCDSNCEEDHRRRERAKALRGRGD